MNLISGENQLRARNHCAVGNRNVTKTNSNDLRIGFFDHFEIATTRINAAVGMFFRVVVAGRY